MDKTQKKKHIFILVGYLVLVSIFACLVRASYLTSIFLFFIVPSIYFSFLAKKHVLKILLFSFFYGSIVSLVADYFGMSWGYWVVPQTIFPIRILSVIPIEDFIWGIGGTFVSIMFYKTYFDQKTFKINKSKLIQFLLANAILLFLFVVYINTKIKIPYFFAVGSLLLFLPPIILTGVFKKNKLLKVLPTLCIYLFVVGFELSSLYNQHWIFNANAQVLAWVDIFNLRFPLEEFFAFFIFGPIANILYYQYFFESI